MMIELVGKRQENSKTFRLNSGQRQLEISIGAIHYKDNYADKSEKWKDIDLTWVGNKISKAPYELTIEGKLLTIRDKKNYKVSTIEFAEIDDNPVAVPSWQFSRGLARIENVALDTDLEIVADLNQVRFARVLKSDKAPVKATFKIVGSFKPYAWDAEGDLPVVTSIIDGVLTEQLKPDRKVKYPVRVDPTWQPTANSDCAYRRPSDDFWSLGLGYFVAGATSTVTTYGGGVRFPGVAIPQGATIDTAVLIVTGRLARSDGTCNSRISAEDVDDAPTFADDKAAFDTRYAARTTARVDWDNVEAFVVDTEHTSPDISTIIQEVIDRGGWATGQGVVIFWEDYDDRTSTTGDARRFGWDYASSNAKAQKLVVTYTTQTGWAGGNILGVVIATASKINEVALADITKVNGVA